MAYQAALGTYGEISPPILGEVISLEGVVRSNIQAGPSALSQVLTAVKRLHQLSYGKRVEEILRETLTVARGISNWGDRSESLCLIARALVDMGITNVDGHSIQIILREAIDATSQYVSGSMGQRAKLAFISCTMQGTGIVLDLPELSPDHDDLDTD